MVWEQHGKKFVPMFFLRKYVLFFRLWEQWEQIFYIFTYKEAVDALGIF